MGSLSLLLWLQAVSGSAVLSLEGVLIKDLGENPTFVAVVGPFSLAWKFVQIFRD